MATKVTTGLISADAALVDLNIDANTLYVDASANRVGIGKTDPSSALHVKGDEVQIEDPSGGYKLHLNADTNPVVITANDNTGANYSGFRLKTNNGGAYPVTVMDVYPSGGAYVGFGAGARTDTQMLISRAPSSDSQTTPETVLVLSNPCTTTASDIKVGQGPRLLFEIPDDQTGNKATGAAIAALKEIDSDSNSQSSLAFYTSGDDETLDQNMTILSDGKVGIGTGSPGNILHVHQPDASSNSYVHITQADGGSANTDGLSIGIEDGGVNAVIRNRENGYLRMYTNNTERMRILSDGKVGIGTTSPNNKLHLEISGNNGAYADADNPLFLKNSSTTDGATVGQYFGCGNGVGVVLTTHFPNADTNGEGHFSIATRNSSNSLAERMRLNSEGKLGIGTDSPASRLHVNTTASESIARFAVTGQRYTQVDWYNGSNQKGAIWTDNTDEKFAFYTPSGWDLDFYAGALLRWQIHSDGTFLPNGNNTRNIGTASTRVSVLYTANAVNVSDQTLKTEIEDCDLGLDFINTLQPKSYKNLQDVGVELEEGHDDYDRKHYGLIAQDLKDGSLKDSVYGKKDGEYSLAYNDLIAPLIKAVQELKAENDSLKARIETLEG